MSSVRIAIDSGVGKSAEIEVDDHLTHYGQYVEKTQEALDEAYRQASAWIQNLRLSKPEETR